MSTKCSTKGSAKENIKLKSTDRNAHKTSDLQRVSLFAVLLFACLLAVLFIAMMNASPAHAADSGVKKGVPWRITDDYDLILGEEDRTCDLSDLVIGTDIPGGSKVKRVYSLGKLKAGSSCRLFNGCSSLTNIDMSGLDTSNVKYMSSMFSGCRSLKRLRLSGLDTSNVTYMSWMFYGCKSLESISFDGFDTGNVKNMGIMFNSCDSLKSLDLHNFDTRRVERMDCMFGNCESLANLDLRSFDTSNVKDMNCMFDYCKALKSVDLRSFDTRKVKDMRQMFRCCSALKRLDLSSFVISRNVDKANIFQDSGIKQIALSQNAVLNACYKNRYDRAVPGPGPWKRISMLSGKQAKGPVISCLEKYKGSAPGWYRFLSPNPIKLKGKTVKIKRKYLKKKAKVVKRAKALQVTNAQGKVTYQLTGVKKAKYKKYFKVNTKTGNITVRKKLKKGKYKLSIKAMAAGNNWYNKATAGATVVIKVK